MNDLDAVTVDAWPAETSGSSTQPVQRLDLGGEPTPLAACERGSCNKVDIVLVIDNSGTMGEEQLNLAANLPRLVDALRDLRDSGGNRVQPSVNLMVTTTDMGGPSCRPYQPSGYVPQRGAPVRTGCNERIARFTGLVSESTQLPLVRDEACTQVCPVDVVPAAPYLHFDAGGSNVAGDAISEAISCLGPQGIDGCGYEAPLEAMMQAINPHSCWNDPSSCEASSDVSWGTGFLRPDAVLAIAIVTDEADCSVEPRDGLPHLIDEPRYWATDPQSGRPGLTSAVCVRAGVQCEPDEASGSGGYRSCSSVDRGVLHPVARYAGYLRWLREAQGKEVVMLGILGVPQNGGVAGLRYRDWRDGVFEPEGAGGDILPAEWAQGIDAADKRYEFGPLGPGCTGIDEAGGFMGQAIAPVRVREVCESLDYTDDDGVHHKRCCIESICSADFSAAISCLSGALGDSVTPAG